MVVVLWEEGWPLDEEWIEIHHLQVADERGFVVHKLRHAVAVDGFYPLVRPSVWYRTADCAPDLVWDRGTPPLGGRNHSEPGIEFVSVDLRVD